MVTVPFIPSHGSDPRRQLFTFLEQLLAIPLRNDADLADLARDGLPVDVIDRLEAKGLKPDELAFTISRRTLIHRRRKGERLSIEDSDRVIRLARIMAQACTVFGNVEKAMGWLRNAQMRFASRTALEMTTTEHGARLVEEALVQIDEGHFA
ncbi:antitoxin (plasmid) [Paraburkholderia caribensis MBA4]|uniref:Antitoxin n=1 Tax=Paraburkholderia caribensis MBA4 TaxID=1323664 RepID=A0A0P0RQV9_9BURK|nr:antitoxin Xre/MbcA/ParS toxin-binding domain-containing protein [Paraburkholderia caribensis]ALL71361.1 antitoxin [Paraburkholderia caribensis MBA4]